MAEKGNVILYLGAYGDRAAAVADFDAIRALHAEKKLGDFEAAVFLKEEGGKVRILDTTATERSFGAKAGAATGAVIGLIFPPALIGTALAGAGVGALAGHFMRGLKRDDIKTMGEMLDAGEAGVVLIGYSELDDADDRFLGNASNTVSFTVADNADGMKKVLTEAEAEAKTGE